MLQKEKLIDPGNEHSHDYGQDEKVSDDDKKETGTEADTEDS